MIRVSWGAAGVALVVAAAAVEAIRRAFQAPDILYRLYHEDQARTRAAIESDHVLPGLAALVLAVIERIRPWMQTQRVQEDVDLGEQIQDSLQAVDYLPQLQMLSGLYGDHRDVMRMADEAQRWGRRKGWFALIFLVGFLGAMPGVIIAGIDWPTWSFFAGGMLILVGASVGVTSWSQEVSARNRLVDLFRKYGQHL